MATRTGWGLVLSGGGACGLASIGVLEVLDDEGLAPRSIAGSSMGAIVAALHALGHSPAVMRALARSLAPAKVVRLSDRPLRSGLHGGVLRQQLERYLEPLVGDARIGECRIPFVCVAGRVRQPVRWTQLMSHGFVEHMRDSIEPYVFPPEARIIDAVRASSAIPVVFSPALVDGEEFVDLVHFGAIPARTLRRIHSPEVLIATDTQPRYDAIEAWLPSPLRRFLAAGREELEASIAACDLVLRPELPASMLRFDRADAFCEAGVRCARERIGDIQRLLAR